ncbi:4Fe-4S dicluster domain-containing protein [Zhaonella formicivorans]|uniref:4Fe-4S dicluster domain-containing protein n=1 Tax=Zhaonella formicivorans TaxID=2528593 RepID=UPI0010E30377|nr:4Fe-4S dicluster domain-containing protein [Zhaonella formicivorans]
MSKFISVNAANCTGCKACMLACSFAHEGESGYSLARLKIKKNEPVEECFPVVCHQCEEAHCQKACPVGAIVENEKNGVLIVLEEECIGCQACVDACPYGAMFFLASKNVAAKCDLCGGDPACIQACKLPGCLELASNSQ